MDFKAAFVNWTAHSRNPNLAKGAHITLVPKFDTTARSSSLIFFSKMIRKTIKELSDDSLLSLQLN